LQNCFAFYETDSVVSLKKKQAFMERGDNGNRTTLILQCSSTDVLKESQHSKHPLLVALSCCSYKAVVHPLECHFPPSNLKCGNFCAT